MILISKKKTIRSYNIPYFYYGILNYTILYYTVVPNQIRHFLGDFKEGLYKGKL